MLLPATNVANKAAIGISNCDQPRATTAQVVTNLGELMREYVSDWLVG